MTGFRKYDRVTAEVDGEIRTLTITKRLLSTDEYEAVTGAGKRYVIAEDQIVGLA